MVAWNIPSFSRKYIGAIRVHCYCWWTKSCTTKDDDYPIIYRVLTVLTIPGGAGFCPSTVCWFTKMFFLIAKHDQSLKRWLTSSKASVLKTPFVETYQVDGWNPKQPPGMVLKPVVKNGISTRPQLVSRISAINSINMFWRNSTWMSK